MAPRWTYAQHFDEHRGNVATPLTPAQLGMSATAVGTALLTGKIDRSIFAIPNAPGTPLTTGEAMTAATAAFDLLEAAAARAGTPITTSTPPAEIISIAASLGTPQWGDATP
jgi:hypothetical protein